MSGALGCATNFNQMREDHAGQFPKELAEKSEDLVMGGESLDLDQCTKIALENKLNISIADIIGKDSRSKER
jgi:hypothetical protein